MASALTLTRPSAQFDDTDGHRSGPGRGVEVLQESCKGRAHTREGYSTLKAGTLVRPSYVLPSKMMASTIPSFASSRFARRQLK
jgi:hypothetical protein